MGMCHGSSVSRVEALLQTMFPSGYPVLCSSGRSALTFTLIESRASRFDLVGVFPYASHCVLDAVSRVATPLAGPTSINALLRIVYHQWGYVQEKNIPENTIEDCVDALCVPGTNLFPGGGRFEIWSLPKILGVTSGGVLWCRDENTAIRIRSLRDSRSGGGLQWLLRLLARYLKRVYVFWHAEECNGGNISRFQTGEIITAIRKWDEFVDDRRKKLDKVWPLAVDWLSKPTSRLPPVVPIEIKVSEVDVKKSGVTSGFRMFERIPKNGSRELEKLLPIPIHQDVSYTWLDSFMNSLTLKNRR